MCFFLKEEPHGGCKPNAPLPPKMNNPVKPKPLKDELETSEDEDVSEDEEFTEEQNFYSVPIYTKCAKCGKEIEGTYISFYATAKDLNCILGISTAAAAFNLNDSMKGVYRRRKAYCMECGQKIYNEIV